MRLFLYNFTYKGHEVCYWIMARTTSVRSIANQIARQRELTWRAAIDAREKEQAPWS